MTQTIQERIDALVDEASSEAKTYLRGLVAGTLCLLLSNHGSHEAMKIYERSMSIAYPEIPFFSVVYDEEIKACYAEILRRIDHALKKHEDGFFFNAMLTARDMDGIIKKTIHEFVTAEKNLLASAGNSYEGGSQHDK